MAEDATPPVIGAGMSWEQFRPGQRWVTPGRSITEHDLMAFVTLAGMQEPLFLDTTAPGALGPRPVPGALTYALVEGMALRLVQGTGMAMLESLIEPLAPVRVGDTIQAACTVASVVPTSRGNRGVVGFSVSVTNQHGQAVMRYSVKRLLAGQPQRENTP